MSRSEVPATARGRSGKHGLFDPSGDPYDASVTARDDAAYAQLLRAALTDPGSLDISQLTPSDQDLVAAAENAAAAAFDNLYARATNLAARASFHYSDMTVAEHIELAALRKELYEAHGVDVP